MQFHLHNDCAKAAAPRNDASARALAQQRGAEPPPRPVRAHHARALVSTAARVDRESARRALAS
jgi:hypothetical protein